MNYDYNIAGQVTAVRENGATSGIGVLAAYSYNDQGRRTNITRGNGVDTNLGFDVLSRLTSLENDMTGAADDQTLTFTHIVSGQIATRANSNAALPLPWPFPSIFDSLDQKIAALRYRLQRLGRCQHPVREL